MIELKALKKFWVITINQNDSTIVHHGVVDAGQAFATGQPCVEEYDNEADYIERLSELGIEVEISL